MVCFGTIHGLAQQKPASAAKPGAGQAAAAKSPGAKQPVASAKPAAAGTQAQNQTNDIFGGDSKDRPKGPTEITATQEAQFDTKTRTGVFIGNVKVVDPQFTMTADRLTVHLNKDEDGGGLNEAVAQGNVVIIHVNQPKTPGQQAPAAGTPTPAGQTAANSPPAAQSRQPPTAGTPTPAGQTAANSPPAAQSQQPPTSVGKSDNAVYEAKDGSVTLTGWPQVTQGGNTHVATAPGVRMVLFRDGRMQTYGSTRTLIEDRTATNNPNANGSH
jgi:lipopolysaccharide export system protein LptA